jgi:PKD repeat protein
MRKILMPALILTATLSLVACSGNSTPSATNTAPVANFTITPTSGPAALTVTTANTSSDADAADTLTYDWNWGDSTPNSAAAAPTHTFAAAGTYTVTLSAKDSKNVSNSTHSKTATVTVTAPVAVAPTVLSVTPTNASLGNPATTPIVVTFSTPMDVTATQMAFQSSSAGLTSGNVVITWTGGNTIMTVTPNAPLAFTSVATVAPGIPLNYSYAINTGAKAAGASGLNMAATYTSSFKTAVEHTGVLFPSDPLRDVVVTNLSGSFSTTLASNNASMAIGDNGSQAIGAYLSFDLSSLPAALPSTNITAAQLMLRKSGVDTSSPFTNLATLPKKLTVHGLYFGDTVTGSTLLPTNELASDLDSTTLALETATFSPSVLGKVQTDWTNRAAQNSFSQYQLRFAKLSAVAGADLARIGSNAAGVNAPMLKLTYTSDN